MSKKTVLLVDDELRLLNAVGYGLAKEFFLIKARNGQKAWELLELFKVDCLVLDIDMPVMDGIELLVKIKDSGIVTNIIMTTGKDCRATRKRCNELGADRYILKPYNYKTLIEHIYDLQ